MILSKHPTFGVLFYYSYMKTFELHDQEFIELNRLLKIMSMVGTGGEAKIRISEGEALLNGEPETQVRKKLRSGDVIEFGGEKIAIK